MREADVYLKRQKLRRGASQFVTYLGGDASVEFALPADSDIYGRSTAPLTTVEDFTVSVNGVNRAAPNIAADTIFLIGRFKQGTLLQAFSGVDLLINAGLGRYVSFGTPPDPVAASPLVVSDFKNGVYSIAGVSKVFADIWEENLDWGAVDRLHVEAGVGLTPGSPPDDVSGTYSGNYSLTSEAFAASGYEFVCVVTSNATFGSPANYGQQWNMGIVDTTDWTSGFYGGVRGSADGGVTQQEVAFAADYSEAHSVSDSLPNNSINTSAKFAFLFSAASVAGSFAGRTTQTATPDALVGTMNILGLTVGSNSGASGGGKMVIEKIEFYALTDPAAADLTVLSGA